MFKISSLPQKTIQFFFAIVKDLIKRRQKHNIMRPDMINILLETRKSGLEDVDSNKPSKTKMVINSFWKLMRPSYPGNEIYGHGCV